MEHMTQKELETLRNLQAKQKRVQRAEEEFLKESDLRKDELIARWNIKDRLTSAAEIIGTDAETLYAWITSEPQVSYFQRHHQTEQIQSAENESPGW